MYIKKQIPSLRKLYTKYEEVPESFLDETVVDSYFYHNILDIALIEKKLFDLAKIPTKKFLLSNSFSFAN